MYVATPQGYRRKIGPRSRYGTTSNEPAYGDGVGPQGPQSSMNRGTGVGSGRSSLEANFGSNADRVSRERAEREKADQYLFDQEKRKANQARKREHSQRSEAKTAQDTSTARSVSDAVAKGGNSLSKMTGGIGAFLSSQRSPAQVREARAKQDAADRAKGRAKYEAEKSGKAATPAMAEKKPEPRKEAAMPTAAHSSPAKPAAAPKPTAKPEQASTKAPAGGFSDSFYKQFAPTKTTIKLPEPEKPAPKPKPTPGKVQVARAVNKVVKGTKYAATLPLRNAAESAMAPVRAVNAVGEFVSKKVKSAKKWWETGE